MTRQKWLIFSLFAIVWMSIVTGCRSTASAEAEPINPIIPTILATPAPEDNPVIFDQDQAAAPQSGEPPLRFTFPTPAQPPVSAWRPPLYPVPWAINPHDHFYFLRPIAVDEVNWPLANYRYGDFFPETDIVHTGIDITAERGTPVLAAADGKVVWAGYGLYKGAGSLDDPYGLAVSIKHNFGYDQRETYTIYAHMDRVDVQVDQVVKAGDQLGIVGNTGFTTGPHLHFEVRVERNSFFVTRNPELWLAPPQGWGVLTGRLLKREATPLHHLDITVKSLDTQDIWKVRTYGPLSVNSDEFYNENMVLSDLPAGKYEVIFTLNNVIYRHDVEIKPGMVTYFKFQAGVGFSDELPAGEPGGFTPVDEVTNPTTP